MEMARDAKELVALLEQSHYGGLRIEFSALAQFLHNLKRTGEWKKQEGYEHKGFEDYVLEYLELDRLFYAWLMWQYPDPADKGGEQPSDPAAYWMGKALKAEEKIKEMEKKLKKLEGENKKLKEYK
jgi:hypothetical protein